MTDEELKAIATRVKVARTLHERYEKRRRWVSSSHSHYREDRENLYDEVIRLRSILKERGIE